MTSNNPAGLMYLFQIVFALYMLVTTIVLINLLIAMMSDTYQRIQASNLSSLCSLANQAISFSSNNLMSSGSLAWPSSLGGQLRLKSESSISRR